MLTFKPSRTGDLVAAYLGACRVGYAQRGSPSRGWTWNLSLVRPEGGLYMGREPDLEGAQRALEACAGAWVEAALGGAKTKVAPKSKKVVASSEI